MLAEFKKFALRGNVVDPAVAVIIGAAFGLIISSLVNDTIMPVIGAITGGLDFSSYYVPLNAAVKTGMPLADAKKAGAVLAYGNFITVLLNFLIIAFVLFIAIQAMNRLKKKEEAKPAEPPGIREAPYRDPGLARAKVLSRIIGRSGPPPRRVKLEHGTNVCWI